MEEIPKNRLPADVAQKLRAQLSRHEGVKLRPYRDSVGKLTIGIGRNLDDVGISLLEAGVLCDNDVARAYYWLTTHYGSWFDALDPIRQAALVNLTFNVGGAKFAAFHNVIGALDRRDYHRAALEMLDSAWSSQVGDRARELAAQVLTGVWTPGSTPV